MTDRLQKLLRQRALLQEHIAWLDHEISELQDVPALPASARPPAPVAAKTQPPSSVPSDEVEKILSQFQSKPSDVQTDTRRGCLLMSSIGMGIFLLALAVAYYFYTRHLGRLW